MKRSILGFNKGHLKKMPLKLRNRFFSNVRFQEADCILICAPDLKRLEWYFLNEIAERERGFGIRPVVIVYLPARCDDFFVREAGFVDGVIKEGEWDLLEAFWETKDLLALLHLIEAERQCECDPESSVTIQSALRLENTGKSPLIIM